MHVIWAFKNIKDISFNWVKFCTHKKHIWAKETKRVVLRSTKLLKKLLNKTWFIHQFRAMFIFCQLYNKIHDRYLSKDIKHFKEIRKYLRNDWFGNLLARVLREKSNLNCNFQETNVYCFVFVSTLIHLIQKNRNQLLLCLTQQILEMLVESTDIFYNDFASSLCNWCRVIL